MILLRSCFFVGVCSSVTCLIHHGVVSKESREVFSFANIEPFGFNSGAEASIHLNMFVDTELDDIFGVEETNNGVKIGFVLVKSFNELSSPDPDEVGFRGENCALNQADTTSIVFNLPKSEEEGKERMFVTETHFHHEFTEEDAGVYTLYFVRCNSQSTEYTVSFTVNANYHNLNHNYLSAGDLSLPRVYLILFLIYLIAVAYWIKLIVDNRVKFGIVKTIHYIMIIPVVLKCFVLLLEYIRLNIIAKHGHDDVYFTLSRLLLTTQTFSTSITIVLVCSGWTIIKPLLDSTDKLTLQVVIILQSLSTYMRFALNVRIPGFNGWLRENILHSVDLVVCISGGIFAKNKAVKFLNETSQMEGKKHLSETKRNKLTTFTSMLLLYVLVNYILFDLFVLPALPFTLMWIAPLYTECTDMLLMFSVGYMYAPVKAMLSLPK